MDAALVVSIVTVVISVMSLAVSGALVLRQMRIARDGYALPVVLDLFGKLRTDEYFAADQYVLHKFRAEVPDVVAFTALPTAARAYLRAIGGLYDDLGKLVAHGIVSEELVVGSRGDSVTRVWDIVAPFIYEERRIKGTNLWIYLEDLAARAAKTPPAQIHARLGLLSKAPTAQTPTATQAPAGAQTPVAQTPTTQALAGAQATATPATTAAQTAATPATIAAQTAATPATTATQTAATPATTATQTAATPATTATQAPATQAPTTPATTAQGAGSSP